MATSINTSVSPSIPFPRRVIIDIEEHQRRGLNDSIEGTNRGTNTSPAPDPEEQAKEVTGWNHASRNTRRNSATGVLETQDTNIKQVNTIQDQDSEPLQAQNIGEIEVPDAQDTSDIQVQDDGTDSQHNDEEHDPDILDDQTSKASQEDNYHTAIDNDKQDDNTIWQPNHPTIPVKKHQGTHYRGRLLKFYTNVTRLFTNISTTLTS